jgi:hypothetical protein
VSIRGLYALLFAFSAVALPAFADDALFTSADEFMSELQFGKFDEAAKSFHYPESYTSAELAADQKGVADSLRSLLREIGDIQSVARVTMPNGAFLTFGLMGGDIPYWEKHPTLNSTHDVSYRATAGHDGEVFFVVSLIQSHAGWETRLLTFEMPGSRSNAAKRFGEILRKTFAPSPPDPPKVPNPAVNADAPVRVFNLASVRGGAPVTLIC